MNLNILARVAPIALMALGACSSSSPAPCGQTTLPPTELFLVYPIAGATAVPTSLGDVVFAGTTVGATLSVQSPTGPISVGSPTAAPSPLPSPYATPPLSVPYFAVSVPTLSAATTYSVDFTYSASVGPPKCTQLVTKSLGSFTTQ